VKNRYRADIDGLRALAVSSVVLFHAEIPGFKGGFIGVDIFFVISGFLITSIISWDLKRGEFSIADFYERRIKRIFPAFFAMLIGVTLVGLLLQDAVDLSRLGWNATAATLFISNFAFWFEIGYFAPSAEKNPLLHTWSLSVEEQFYVFFPLFMALFSSRAPKALKPCLVAGSAISLIAGGWGAFHFPGATFYLLPTRAWELAVGSLLALGIAAPPRTSKQASLASVFGILLIAGSVQIYSKRTPFPGLMALPPVLGTALLIWSGMLNHNTWCRRLLSWRPVVFVGLISYSLYLWHWPIIAFWKYVAFRPMEWLDSLSIIIVSLMLGVVSWRFVERPFRGEGGIVHERRTVFMIGGVGIFMAVIIGLSVWGSGGIPWRFDNAAPYTAIVKRARDNTWWIQYANWEAKNESMGAAQLAQPPVVGSPGVQPTFALIGDSHAQAMIPAIELQALRVGQSGYIITRGGTPPLLDINVKQIPLGDDGFDEARYHNRLIEFLRERPELKTIILVGRWPTYIRDHYVERGEEQLCLELTEETQTASDISTRSAMVERGLDRMVERLIGMNRNVILVGCVPEVGFDVPTAFSISRRLPWILDLKRVVPTKADYERRQLESNLLLSRISNRYHVDLIGSDSSMWDSNGRALVLIDGELLYRDDDHLSQAGALHFAHRFDGVFDQLGRVERDSR